MIEPSPHIIEATEIFLSSHQRGMGDSGRGDLSRLLTSIGCRRFIGEHISAAFERRPSRSTSDLAALRICLPKLLALSEARPTSYDAAVLLGELHYYSCWKDFTLTEAGSRQLYDTILYFIANYSSSSDVDAHIGPRVCGILNEWLCPAAPWSETPGAVVVCQHLFGDSWCALFLDSFPAKAAPAHTSAVGYMVQAIVKGHRPPLLPGLCREQDAVEAAPLPALGGPA